MSQSNVILNCSTSTGEIINNARWENKFQTTHVYPGDTIRLHTAILNSNIDQASDIVLENNVTISIEFGYYQFIERNDRHGASRIYHNIPGNFRQYENKYYIEVEDATVTPPVPVTLTVNLVIPAGNYSPDLLVTEINRRFNELTGYSQQTFDPVENGFLKALKPVNNADPTHMRMINPAGGWNNAWYEMLDDIDDVSLGASTVSLSYDADKGKFNWDTAYSPYFDNNGQPEIRIHEYEPGRDAGNYDVATQFSGIYLVSLGPDSFWSDTLGFDLTEANRFLLNGNDANTRFDNFHNRIIRPLPDQSMLINHDNLYVDTREKQFTVNYQWTANNSYTPQGTAGHYLIAIDTLFSSEYQWNQYNNQILAIASKQNNFNSYITVYGGSSTLEYIYNSTEVGTITKVLTRILDGITHQEDLTVGKHHSVFLEIVRGNYLQQKQLEASKKTK